MKKMMNWVLAATLCICGAIVFTSCTSSDDNPAGPDAGTPAIAMIGKLGHVDYFKQIESAFRSACEENGVEALYYTTASENTHQEQIAIVNELKQLEGKQLKGIIYAPSYGPAGESADAEVAAFARQRGIPVIIIDTELKAGSPLAGSPYFGTDNAAAGRELAGKVAADKVAAFVQSNSIALERAEAFKAVKPATTIYPVDEAAKSAVEAVIDEYDDFVFFNGHILSSVLNLLKEKGKNVYTFDVYGEFLDELIAGNTHFKGIMVQNTFGMAHKAVEAVLSGAAQGEMIPTPYITSSNLGDDRVKPFLDFYGKEAYPAIEGLAEKIVGKWINMEEEGMPVPTNSKGVFTLTADFKGDFSTSYGDLAWYVHAPFEYTLKDNTISWTVQENEFTQIHINHTVTAITDTEMMTKTYVQFVVYGNVVQEVGPVEMHYVRLTADYHDAVLGTWEGRVTSDQSEYDDGEPHRWEYKADGTYVYYSLVDGQWTPSSQPMSAYFVDGTLLCCRWKMTDDSDELREWWEVESIQDGVMKWTALRQREDGSTYTATFQMTKVE